MNRDRPALEPGGCECFECGAIFIGEPWHDACRVCADAAILKLIEAARSSSTPSGGGDE